MTQTAQSYHSTPSHQEPTQVKCDAKYVQIGQNMDVYWHQRAGPISRVYKSVSAQAGRHRRHMMAGGMNGSEKRHVVM